MIIPKNSPPLRTEKKLVRIEVELVTETGMTMTKGWLKTACPRKVRLIKYRGAYYTRVPSPLLCPVGVYYFMESGVNKLERGGVKN